MNVWYCAIPYTSFLQIQTFVWFSNSGLPPHLSALGISGKSHPHPLLVAHTSCSVSLPASECGLQQLWPPFPSPKQAYHHEGHLFKADSPLCLWSFQRSTVNFASPFFFFFFYFFFFLLMNGHYSKHPFRMPLHSSEKLIGDKGSLQISTVMTKKSTMAQTREPPSLGSGAASGRTAALLCTWAPGMSQLTV